jgi:nucleoside-diphosphate-sugar epimerase
MRVAVTGAGGFTGRFVVAALTRHGATCVPLNADLRDPAAIEREVEAIDCDRLIHLAARAFVDQSDWEAFYAVNQLGTFHLLDAFARRRPGLRCILASSAQVYGQGAEGLISEDAATAPANHYAVSKLAMEQGAKQWRDRLDLVVTRPFNYTGVGQHTDYLISKIVDHFRRRASVIELGNLWVKRDFGDVRAVADAYARLALASSSPELLNICTGVVHSIEDVLSVMTQVSGYRPEVVVNPKFVRANDVAVLGGDAARLRVALPGWPVPSLAETLTWMYEAASN